MSWTIKWLSWIDKYAKWQQMNKTNNVIWYDRLDLAQIWLRCQHSKKTKQKKNVSTLQLDGTICDVFVNVSLMPFE